MRLSQFFSFSPSGRINDRDILARFFQGMRQSVQVKGSHDGIGNDDDALSTNRSGKQADIRNRSVLISIG